ncbi:hypothetical protein BLA60_12820 [Actinophytocola xinjiangensis]|uniref:Uncharacterized protein n=2 Tax=Actinophytocola xinjiangensis TaxID=485602 RepID=A0A7Z1AYP1_9PSEU|nr:hypothetical protein BLA60_12820 [Actinophytocola xinjiangensis]
MLLAAVAVFAALVTLLANLLGLTGFTAEEETVNRVRATVSAAAPCTDSGGERVTFTQDGRDREARFDGCGHTEGEQVEINVPDGATGDDLTVQAAHNAVDSGGSGGVPGVVLLFGAAVAGGMIARWWWRQPTSSGGESQVLH